MGEGVRGGEGDEATVVTEFIEIVLHASSLRSTSSVFEEIADNADTELEDIDENEDEEEL